LPCRECVSRFTIHDPSPSSSHRLGPTPSCRRLSCSFLPHTEQSHPHPRIANTTTLQNHGAGFSDRSISMHYRLQIQILYSRMKMRVKEF
jgi:hypothetical protein